MARLGSFALFGACVLASPVARAQASVLIAASDPTQIAEVELAKVAATDSPFWLSVKLAGPAKLAVVVSAEGVETAPAADAWLRALDFSTRVRVMPPAGPLAACTDVTGQPADSGLPEPLSLSPSQVSSVSSEVELRRSLTDVGLPADLAPIADFSAQVTPPFRFVLYDAPQSGGSTAALRLSDSEPALAVPGVAAIGRDSLPFTLLALAPTALVLDTGLIFDPSDFAVSYLGATASTNYTAARAAWLSEDPTRWLLEARASTALFAWTEVSAAGEVLPAVSRYFTAASGQSVGSACAAAALTAHARSSHDVADFSCGAADDLSRCLSQLDFADLRLTRLFGSIGAAGVTLRGSDEAELAAPVVATDFDAKDCVSGAVAAPPVTMSPSTPAAASAPAQGNAAVVASSDGSTTAVDGNSNSAAVVVDSCSGDSSSSDSSSTDSCSGDSSNDSDSNDSCTGDSSSSSGSDSNDSCSGDSSGSSDSDSSGCGKSNYDGDTCSGNSANSASPQDKSAAALASGPRAPSSQRPRRVHLSLFMLLAASIALPLRRKKLGRAAATV